MNLFNLFNIVELCGSCRFHHHRSSYSSTPPFPLCTLSFPILRPTTPLLHTDYPSLYDAVVGDKYVSETWADASAVTVGAVTSNYCYDTIHIVPNGCMPNDSIGRMDIDIYYPISSPYPYWHTDKRAFNITCLRSIDI